MKIVKYIFLLLLLVTIGLVVFIATQEGKYDIKKERVIKVPRTTLYNYINDYRNWENVGILTDNDTTAIYSFSQTTSGKNAKTNWKLNGSEGEVKTITAADNDSLVQKAVIDGQPSDISWSFKDTVGGTKMFVRIKGELSFQDKAYAVLRGGVQEKLESKLEAGLKNLDNFLVHELGAYKVNVQGVVTKTGTFYLKHSVTSGIADVGKKSSEALNKLLHFVKENKIATNGAPFNLYKKYDVPGNIAEFAVCVPIKEEIFTMPGSEYEGAKMEPFQAMKVTLKGDYSHLKKAWDAGYKEISLKAIQLNTTGLAAEVYTKGMQQTKRPSQWVTDIYIPVGQPALPAAEDAVPAPPVSGAATNAPAVNRPAIISSANTAAKPSGTTQSRPASTAQRPTGTTASQNRTTTSQPAKATSTPANKPAGTTTTKTGTATAQPAKTVPTPVKE